MKLAVLQYEFVANAPQGIPAEWPAEIREIGDNDPAPGDDWVIMTKDEYQTHLAEYKDDYNVWAATQVNEISVSIPDKTTSLGTKGQLAYDSNYLYICISKDTWRRVALSIW